MRCETIFGPNGWDSVESNVVHQVFHLLSHCELSLKGKLNVSEISNDDSDEDVHVLTLLHESVLIWSSAILTKLSSDIVDVELVAVKLSLVSNSLHEFLDLFFEC